MSGPNGRYFNGKNGATDREKLLIVEGTDDQFFFDQLLHEIGADPKKFGIVQIEGKGNLSNELGSLLKSASFTNGTIKKFSVILDADEHPADTIRTVQQVLRDQGLPVPAVARFQSNGAIEVGLLIIPSDNGPGNLETLCLKLLKDENKYKSVRKFFNVVSKKYKINDHKDKRLIQIYLALCKELCRGAGQGFKQGYIPYKRVALRGILDFLNLLAA